ncbi:MAG TPA: UPF0149 family protein [Pseudomonadales bacterium]|nr:UPF0149 family protein [Pseudomonadales bacterium]
MAYLNNIQLRILSEFLDSPSRPADTMTLHELRGFLWGLASAPTDIDEDEWMTFVFEGEDPNFRDEQEEENIATLFMGLWDEQFTRIEDDDSELVADEYHWHNAADQRWPLAAWCNGLLKAHYWQEDGWNKLLAETEPVETEDGIFDIAEEVENTLDIASLFADIESAMDGSETENAELMASLPEITEQLPWIMMNYAECGCLLADMLEEQEQEEPYRREQPKIGRNDVCFCGSGKKYKNCCINAANDE